MFSRKKAQEERKNEEESKVRVTDVRNKTPIPTEQRIIPSAFCAPLAPFCG
jgi:hypothetical protein